MPIEHVSDTARWVAVYRAMETERADALFRDPWARRLAGERGEEIVRTMRSGRRAAWAMITRTAVFDEVVLDAVGRRGIDCVVNLAAGLDARPWRLALPASLQWFDVDLPAILAYKAETIGDARPACRYEAVAADLRESEVRRDLFRRLGGVASRALVVSEGLLIYLEAGDVAALARDLHAQPAFRWWLFDMASPRLLEWMNRSWGKEAARGNAPFRFAPAEGSDWFAPHGWREVEYRSQTDEARRLHREMRAMPLYRLLAALGGRRRREELRRMAGFHLLERVEPGLATTPRAG